MTTRSAGQELYFSLASRIGAALAAPLGLITLGKGPLHRHLQAWPEA